MTRLLFSALAVCAILCFSSNVKAQVSSKKQLDSAHSYNYPMLNTFYGCNKTYYVYDNQGRMVQQTSTYETSSTPQKGQSRIINVFNNQDSSIKAPDTLIFQNWDPVLKDYVSYQQGYFWHSADWKQTISIDREWDKVASQWINNKKDVTDIYEVDSLIYEEVKNHSWNAGTLEWEEPDTFLTVKWNGITLYRRYQGHFESTFIPGDSSIYIYKSWDKDLLSFVNDIMEITVSNNLIHEQIEYVYYADEDTHEWPATSLSNRKRTTEEYDNNGLLLNRIVYKWNYVNDAWEFETKQANSYDFEQDLVESSSFLFNNGEFKSSGKTLYFYKGGVHIAVEEVRGETLRNCNIPNPVGANTTLEGSCFNDGQEYHIQITDIAGRSIASQTIRKGERINGGDVNRNQLYFITVYDEKQQIVLTDKVIFVE